MPAPLVVWIVDPFVAVALLAVFGVAPLVALVLVLVHSQTVSEHFSAWSVLILCQEVDVVL